MGTSALNKLCTNTIDIPESDFYILVKHSEQLRILKNYAKLEEVYTKEEVIKLIKAMEAKNE